jgi:TctA family transporter
MLDPRKMRLAKLMLTYAAKITGVLIGILVVMALTILAFKENALVALTVLIATSLIGFFSFMMAKDKLEDLERDEKRVMDRMRRDG